MNQAHGAAHRLQGDTSPLGRLLSAQAVTDDTIFEKSCILGAHFRYATKRDSVIDGLGRLASVTEYPGTGSYGTTYSYNVLGDLTGVNQSGKVRTFVYDSLKRLIAATNPETYAGNAPAALGCVNGIAPYAACYYYDANGNLTKKTDNRGISTTYLYDALNRMRSKTYGSSGSVSYGYDQAGVSFSRGRLTSVATTQTDASTTNYLGFDALGRILSSSQTTAGNTYRFAYTYNLAGALTSESYPSGRVVTTCYDGADRVSQVGLSTCNNANGLYASNIQYAAHGAPTQYVLGNNVWHKPSYNSRLQMAAFADLINNDAGHTLLSTVLDWGTTANNGNLKRATYYHGGPSYPQYLVFDDSFAYDGVNRLVTASETGGWTRSFSYDAFGNMTPSGNPPPPPESFNGNNQIVTQSYDQAGNQLTVNGNNLQYDYEDHVVSETDGVTHAVETYVFDGNGNRVEKYGPGGVPRVVFAYDAMGRMAAEYSTALDSPSCVTCYLSPDHLGTARVVTDQNASVVARHDYLPFGEELAASQFGRDSHWGSGNDSINQKFTGKERDSESGLDYFGARYYGSALGRFTSPDDGSDQHSEDPQSWNLYGYVRNNPLTNTDPSGMDCVTTSNQTLSGVSVSIARGGSADTCSGTFVDGTVNEKSVSYNGTSLGYSFSNDTAAGAGTISFGSGNSDISPFGRAVVQSVGRQTNSMYGLMGTFMAASAVIAAGAVAYDPLIEAYQGYRAARTAAQLAAALKAAQEALKRLSPDQYKLLQQWLGPIKTGSPITPPPPGLSTEAMQRYLDVAQAYIAGGGSGAAIQATRVEALKAALGQQ